VRNFDSWGDIILFLLSSLVSDVEWLSIFQPWPFIGHSSWISIIPLSVQDHVPVCNHRPGSGKNMPTYSCREGKTPVIGTSCTWGECVLFGSSSLQYLFLIFRVCANVSVTDFVPGFVFSFCIGLSFFYKIL